MNPTSEQIDAAYKFGSGLLRLSVDSGCQQVANVFRAAGTADRWKLMAYGAGVGVTRGRMINEISPPSAIVEPTRPMRAVGLAETALPIDGRFRSQLVLAGQMLDVADGGDIDALNALWDSVPSDEMAVVLVILIHQAAQEVTLARQELGFTHDAVCRPGPFPFTYNP